MDKNKSIDGLVSRRTKTNNSKNSTKVVSTAKTKASTVKKAAPKKATPKKPNTKKIVVDSPKEEKPTPESIAEDFLSPVQAFDFDEQSGKLVKSKNPKKPTKGIKKPKMSKKKKIIISIITIIILLLVGAVIWLNYLLSKMTDGGNILDLFSQQYTPLKTDENGRTNILAFGTSGYNMDGETSGGTHDGAQLTDSIMIISLNQETGDAAMLSLPRDFKASSICTGTGKINEVFWCNNMEGDNEQAGAEALMAEVGDILDIDFQYYAHVNWGSLIQIVDILDDIKVTLDEDIQDYYGTGYSYQANIEYDIDGNQAMILSRARYGTANGDFSRSASQQKILIGIKEKIQSKKLSIMDIVNLANTLGDNLRTNFSVDELKTLAHLASEFDFNNIRQVSLIEPEQLVTTGSIGGISYVLPVGGAGYYKDIQVYVKKMFSNNPYDYEIYTILVLNGSEEPGLASTEKSALEEIGYSNIDIDDAPTNFTEKYTLYALSDNAPGTKKLLEERYNTAAKSADELPANINKNYDFIVVLGNNSNHEN